MNSIFNIKDYQRFMEIQYTNKDEHLKEVLDLYTNIVKEYYFLIDNLASKQKNSEKQKAMVKISNHSFTLLFELIINLKYDNFNTIFRLSRSVLENKIFMEFISEQSEEQAFWYNNWFKIKQANKLSDKELESLYPKKEDFEEVKYLHRKFLKTHHKIYSNDYGFAQNSIRSGYITLREITLSTSESQVAHDYYKYFSDLSHSSNQVSVIMEQKLRLNVAYRRDLIIEIIGFLMRSINVITHRLNEYFVLNKQEYNLLKDCISKLEGILVLDEDKLYNQIKEMN